MKITCETEALHTAFQIVGSVVQQRPTRPILATVLVKAADGRLELHATDLEVSIRFEVANAVIEEPGQAAVPQAKLASILRETTDEHVAISTEERHCILTTADSVFRLPTEVAEEFPEIPVFTEEKAYDLDRAEFAEMVSKTSFAAHKGKHRYALNGVLLVIKPNKVRMVATDGRRLAHIEKKAKNAAGAEEAVIVPTKGLDQILKVLTDQDEKIRLNIQENQLLAKTSRALVAAKLVEGHFPPYESVIPTNCDKKVEFERERFFSAVRRTALMTSEESGSILVHVEEGKMRVSSAAPETGEARVELPVEYTGAEFEIGFNPEFLTEFLRAVEEEKISVEFRDPTSAGLFRAGKDFVYVVMPVGRE
jgi:DNA polymerase-3 subunit beta